MDVSVIVVSWNTKELLQKCLQSLFVELEHSSLTTEVIVVDNNSADGSAEMVRQEFPQTYLITNNDNKGFGKANNQAFVIAKGEFVLLLNPDTEVLPGTISELVHFMVTHPNAGIVAPQLLNTDGSIQRSCRAFPSLSGMFYELAGLSKLFPRVSRFRQYKMLDFDHTYERQVDQPEGACLLIRKAVLEQVGTFDEQFFMLFEEVDLCYRTKKAGWEIWFYPTAKIIHHYGQAIKQVKAKMIISSHTGMYIYWSKHYAFGLYALVKPFLYVFLMALAGLRIAVLKSKSLLGRAQPHRMRILEVGCGKGRHAAIQAKHAEVHAIDLSEENIAYARKHHPGPTFEVMSAEALAYPDAYFDVVYAIDILEHVDSVEKTVAEIHRVLKLGGKVVVNIPAADSEEWLLRLRPTYHAEINHVRIFRGDELETVMREHGLTLTKKQARDFSDHAILYYLFTRTTSSHSQLGIGDWRDTWVGRAIFLSHALTKPNLVFTSPLKYIPVWVIGIPAGWVVNGIGNRFFPKSMYYEFIKEK